MIERLKAALERIQQVERNVTIDPRYCAYQAMQHIEAVIAEMEAGLPVAWVWNPAKEAWEQVHMFGNWQQGAIYAFGPTIPAQPKAEPRIYPGGGEVCKADLESQPNQYGIEFGMSGANMTFKIGNQRFTLDYEPDTDDEFTFMQNMLMRAMSHFTPSVKTTVQPKAEPCQHSLADARNAAVQSGYICVKCGALFSAADHAQPKAEPLQEPLAWLYVGKGNNPDTVRLSPPDTMPTLASQSERVVALVKRETTLSEDLEFMDKVLAAAPQAKPLPLTDDWIRERCDKAWVFETVRVWVRLVETAHGITASKDSKGATKTRPATREEKISKPGVYEVKE